MSAALTTLPWVEPDTIATDGKKRQVKFTVKDRAKFDMDEVKRALGPRYADGVKVLTPPTEK
ncbi:hypothetical protein [Frigoriglobus tundricola]|uniref:Uncharacterized protein n=1 Tax=Frigoriglobus tundricola TaxID=2774151 RepID=A0A6M5YSI9_9BACT|nr:hypothetical protein [Frigoriglobus tundricola]QJW96380.1 hypothetical protein FTUN_3937 [Frigoriglobus tundricola]